MSFAIGHPLTAVDMAALRADTDTAFTPTWTDLTPGVAATNEGYYSIVGGWCRMDVKVVFGTSGFAISGVALLGIPAGLEARSAGSNGVNFGTWIMRDVSSGTGFYGGIVNSGSATDGSNAAFVLPAGGRVTTGSPIATLASGDKLLINLYYPLA